MRLSNIWGFGNKKARIEELETLLKSKQIEKEKLKEYYDNEINEYNQKCWVTLCNLSKAHDERDRALKEIESLKEYTQELGRSKGGLATSNKNLSNKVKELKSKINELEKQLKLSMTDKYKVRKLPAGGKTKGQVIGVKDRSVQSKIITQVKEG